MAKRIETVIKHLLRPHGADTRDIVPGVTLLRSPFSIAVILGSIHTFYLTLFPHIFHISTLVFNKAIILISMQRLRYIIMYLKSSAVDMWVSSSSS